MKRSRKTAERPTSDPAGILFRERRLCDIDFKKIKHPVPDKNYKATLPGPPGWQYKINPGQ